MPASARSFLLRALLDSYGSSELCTYASPSSDEATRYRPTERDLLVSTSFRVSAELRLIALSLRRPAFDCASELGATDLPRWFAVGKTTRFIGASIELVDVIASPSFAGRSFLFWYSGYNEDGYVLFNSAFNESSKFTWKYH